ncbi:MAG: outer membrane protein assembly factor BamD [Candidatus Riflebacteria bacterium]|nr:outer membrane protein assembly factor BamD [Candidatus Riflebacteria bacterium]
MHRTLRSLLALTALLAAVALAPGCGCGRQATDRSMAPVPAAGGSVAGPDRGTSGAGGPAPSRGLSIMESAYITSPDQGFGRTVGKGVAVPQPRQLGADFERKYTSGVEAMERGEYAEAMKTFEDIMRQYANSEEASVAEYCIAEIHFRNKSNQMALEAYQRIVEKYPTSPAAQNAREGIEYLKTFEEHERNYVSPDVEDRKRRGF